MSGSAWGILLVILLAAMGAGCGGTSLRAQESFVIGVIVSLNSGVPAAARGALQGATLAAEEINAAGGVNGASITLMVEDDGGNAETALRKFEALRAQNAVAIVGPLTDATAIAVAPAAERGGIPLISPGATGTIPYSGSSFFRTALPAEAQARALAEFIVFGKRARRLSIIQDNNEYGTLVALAFSQRVTALGADVVGTRFYRDGETNFTRHATGVIGDGADAVFIAGYPDEGVLILEAFKARGVQVPLVGSDALYSPDLLAGAGDAATDLYLPAAFIASEPLPAVQEFAGKYRRRFAETPDHFAAQGYDAVKILALAIRRNGRTPGGIRAALQGLRKFPGVTGEISFDRWGAPARPVGIARVRAGQFELVRR
ncbi:MAG: penicillin-binding protein activator [Armatimonadetes bacterium]|nr:penicillin-binding protein activator [Armatimonadota bacterium]